MCSVLILDVFYANFRCATYPPVSASCTMQPDPKDPICCKVPYCNGVAVSGTINGGSVIPTPAPNPHPTASPSPGSNVATPTPAPALPGYLNMYYLEPKVIRFLMSFHSFNFDKILYDAYFLLLSIFCR